MRILVVSDGPRDHAVLPVIMETVLGMNPDCTFLAWSEIRLHRGRGYARRMQFALVQARTSGMAGVVCTVDCDNAHARTRLKELASTRNDDRCNNQPLPTAVGEARPHVEAWLLDDRTAICRVLNLAHDEALPLVHKVASPKDELDRLIDKSESHKGVSRLLTLKAIAQSLDHSRCTNAKSTGLKEFVEELINEYAVKTQ